MPAQPHTTWAQGCSTRPRGQARRVRLAPRSARHVGLAACTAAARAARTGGIMQQLAHLLPRDAALRSRADRAGGARSQLAQLARRLRGGARVSVQPPGLHGGLPADAGGAARPGVGPAGPHEESHPLSLPARACTARAKAAAPPSRTAPGGSVRAPVETSGAARIARGRPPRHQQRLNNAQVAVVPSAAAPQRRGPGARAPARVAAGARPPRASPPTAPARPPGTWRRPPRPPARPPAASDSPRLPARALGTAAAFAILALFDTLPSVLKSRARMSRSSRRGAGPEENP